MPAVTVSVSYPGLRSDLGCALLGAAADRRDGPSGRGWPSPPSAPPTPWADAPNTCDRIPSRVTRAAGRSPPQGLPSPPPRTRPSQAPHPPELPASRPAAAAHSPGSTANLLAGLETHTIDSLLIPRPPLSPVSQDARLSPELMMAGCGHTRLCAPQTAARVAPLSDTGTFTFLLGNWCPLSFHQIPTPDCHGRGGLVGPGPPRRLLPARSRHTATPPPALSC